MNDVSSTVSKLSREVREQIARLREEGHTLEQIVEHLRTMHNATISRSADELRRRETYWTRPVSRATNLIA